MYPIRLSLQQWKYKKSLSGSDDSLSDSVILESISQAIFLIVPRKHNGLKTFPNFLGERKGTAYLGIHFPFSSSTLPHV